MSEMQEEMAHAASSTAIIYGDNGKTRINGFALLKAVINRAWVEYTESNKHTYPKTKKPIGFDAWYVEYKTQDGELIQSLALWSKNDLEFSLPKGSKPQRYVDLSHFKHIKQDKKNVK